MVFWLASLGCSAGLQWFVTIAKGPTSDESSIPEALGFQWYVLPTAMVGISLCTTLFIYWSHKKMKAIQPFVVALVAGTFAAYAWVDVIGPAILGG